MGAVFGEQSTPTTIARRVVVVVVVVPDRDGCLHSHASPHAHPSPHAPSHEHSAHGQSTIVHSRAHVVVAE